MSSHAAITVSTHVGRDLLQSANIFKTADAAVWEYIVNGLQYVDAGTSPSLEVVVDHSNKSISISDNGSGMDEDRLSHFFTMHGENIERREGRGGRGKYGTGKSAAFGIGKTLIVSTTKDGIKNVLKLTKDDVLASSGTEIPVQRLVTNEPDPGSSNGTTIIIEDIFLPKIDTAKIIKKVERHLQSYRGLNPVILVGDHECTYKEPPLDTVVSFRPNEGFKQALGDIELLVRIAKSPLATEERGIAISCGEGNLVAIEDGGVCAKEMGEYLFGEVNVLALESDDYEMDAFDASRDMKLRPEHPVSAALIAFVASSLEQQRKDLLKRKREASKEQSTKDLQQQAEKIAELLNSDFKEVNDRLIEIRSKRHSSGPTRSRFGGDTGGDDDADGWILGMDERGDTPNGTESEPPDKAGPDVETDRPPPDDPSIPPIAGEANPEGESAVDPVSSTSPGKKRRPRGGFSVEYEHMGETEGRAKYIPDRGLFIINLDHAQVMSAQASLGIQDPGFVRLSFEIVFSEYALALANMAAVEDPDIPADDVIYDARETLNRVSAKSAMLYQ